MAGNELNGNVKKAKSIIREFYKEEFYSGAKFYSIDTYNNNVLEDMKNKEITEDCINVGNCKLSVLAEPEHVILVGRPGFGKSVLTTQIISQVIKRNGKAIIYDSKGDFLATFYDEKRGDLIFNPMDERSVKWNLIEEIKTKEKYYDNVEYTPGQELPPLLDAAMESLGESLIPPSAGTDSGSNENFFRDGARDVLKSLIEYTLKFCGPMDHTNKTLVSLLSEDSKKILEKVQMVNPMAQNFINPPDSNQTAGVLGVLSQFARSLKCMNYSGGDFTVDSWVNDGKPGVLFITGYARIRKKLQPLLSLLVDTIALHVHSRDESLTDRFYFVLDEFQTLQKLHSLVELLTLSRSKGGSVWLATQDLSQVQNIYGQLKSTILNACGTKCIFAVADSKDAREFSDLIGEALLLTEIAQDSGEFQPGGGLSDTAGQNRSLNRQMIERKVVLPSNIMNQLKFNFIFHSQDYSYVKGVVDLEITKSIVDSAKGKTKNFILAGGTKGPKQVKTDETAGGDNDITLTSFEDNIGDFPN